MDPKLKGALSALQIQGRHLTRALILLRDLRIQAINEKLDPKAVRIALLYTLKCDTYHSSQKLSKAMMKALDDLAQDLIEKYAHRVAG